MKTRRGKRIAMVSVAVGIVVLAGAGYALKDRIAEEYWIWKLEKGDPREKASAGLNLAELGSSRCLPYLFRALRDSECDHVIICLYVRWSPGVPTAERDSRESTYRISPLAYALYTLGHKRGEIMKSVVKEDERLRWELAPPRYAEVIHMVRRVWEHEARVGGQLGFLDRGPSW